MFMGYLEIRENNSKSYTFMQSKLRWLCMKNLAIQVIINMIGDYERFFLNLLLYS